ncbi:MAG TPA: hypothetical protein VMC62_04145, partial [Longilinea sp.]|nr:hypothetical protein [Longilinea sp.]
GGVGDESLAQVDFTSVKYSVDFWVKYDRCAGTPQTQSFEDIRHDTYTGCTPGTAVELYTIIDGKHAWPGGNGSIVLPNDKPTMTISATELMWEFFSQHPKP